MPKDQRVDQCRWKFRKYFADAVGQFDEETGCFFLPRDGMSQVRYLPNFRPAFLTTRLASVVS